jgi:hypothetical protein
VVWTVSLINPVGGVRVRPHVVGYRVVLGGGDGVRERSVAGGGIA